MADWISAADDALNRAVIEQVRDRQLHRRLRQTPALMVSGQRDANLCKSLSMR